MPRNGYRNVGSKYSKNKKIVKDNPEEYLKNPEEDYYEELMLQALVIANLKIDLEKKKEYIINFVPKINCWAVCDSFCAGLKDADKNLEFFWKIISKYFKSKKEYEIRFAVVMLLDHYVKEEYVNEIFKVIDNIKNEEYYVEMGIAWLVAELYIKFPKQTMKYLKNCNLNKFTYNKALQKARESYRVSKEEKEIGQFEEKIKKTEELNIKIDNYTELLKKQIEYKNKEKDIVELKDKVIKNQKIKEAIKPKEEKVKNQNELTAKLERELENLKVNIIKGKEKEKEHEKKIEAVDKIGKIYKEYSECTEIKKELLEKGNRLKKIEELELKKVTQVKNYTKLENEYKIMNNEYLDKEDEFFKEQAGIIAEKLEDNKPCPVCGSLEHPCIAKKSTSVLTKQE